ncbi:cell wall hydrolase [Sphingomonas aurantiaca]|uniref:cell wall hydrolase n=1 Tax=Sphingomonas aurantiaca TaxID=185949 RepID=UPI002FE254A8
MTTALSARGTRVLRASLIGISGLAIVGPALVVANAPVVVQAPKRVKLPPGRVVPQAEVPEVEPVKFVDLTPDDARAFNATVPFSTDPNPAARPFRFAGGPEDLARATDCMAAGILFEAGDDTLGERAVAQVVLNRLHHPAFPKTVCGVVFEGQDRSTGCQFSFSCDGAITRWHPTDDAWRRAREVAAAALSGAVFKQVGYATHYHTDWVVPYWQSSLDKITAVNTHLFFRWSGWWGTPRPLAVIPKPSSRSSRSSPASPTRTRPAPRWPRWTLRWPRHRLQWGSRRPPNPPQS